MDTPHNPDCIFCKIVRKEIPAHIIRETDSCVTIVDIKPNNFGHSLVIPKIHCENIYSLPDEAVASVFKEVRDVSVAIKSAVSADGMNTHINNESAAGQAVFHLHIHLIPRFKDDGFPHFPLKNYEYEGQITEVKEKIQKELHR